MDRLEQIRCRIATFKALPSGPTRALMIDDLEYLLAELERAQSEAYRLNYERARRSARAADQNWDDQIEWLKVCGQLKGGEPDDRSGCY
jgi:hypothetical protein